MKILSVLLLGALLSTGAAQAKSAMSKLNCNAGNPVVWVNTDTHVYHLKGSKYFGKTAHGKYLCKRSAIGAHDHMAKGGQQ